METKERRLLQLVSATKNVRTRFSKCYMTNVISSCESFPSSLVDFYWGKSFQFFHTLLRILAYLKSALVWMVSVRPQIFESSNSLIKTMGTVPNASIVIGIIVTFMFEKFFFSGKIYLFLFLFFFFFLFLIFTLWSAGTVVSTIPQVLFFLSFFVFANYP